MRYLGVEVDDALEMAEQTKVCMTLPVSDHLVAYLPEADIPTLIAVRYP